MFEREMSCYAEPQASWTGQPPEDFILLPLESKEPLINFIAHLHFSEVKALMFQSRLHSNLCKVAEGSDCPKQEADWLLDAVLASSPVPVQHMVMTSIALWLHLHIQTSDIW